MKKLLNVLVVAVLAVCMVVSTACGGNDSEAL